MNMFGSGLKVRLLNSIFIRTFLHIEMKTYRLFLQDLVEKTDAEAASKSVRFVC